MNATIVPNTLPSQRRLGAKLAIVDRVGQARPVSRQPSDRVDAILSSGALGPGGALSQVLASYEDRPAQRRMAGAVLDALLESRPLMVEAGTGTGKTLAYLSPAATTGMRVVISTGTRALQEQLANKDVALLRELSGNSDNAIRIAVLKGVNNYVCQRRLAMLAAEPTLSTNANTHDRDLSVVLTWLGKTSTGDRSELGILSEDADVWSRVTTTADARLGSQCPFIERCFVAKARKRAEQSQLIIVNHHLFFTDFALRRRGVGAKVLPDYDAVIFDEAHQLEDIIATHMGPSISAREIARLAAELSRNDGHNGNPWSEMRLLDWLERCATRFFSSVRTACPTLTEGSRHQLPDQLFSHTAVRESWLALDSALDDIAASAERRAAIEEDAPTSARLLSAALTAQRMRDAAAAIAEPEDEPCGQWVEQDKSGLRLCAAPASAAQVIHELIEDTPATIFTSATLTTQGSFNFLRSRLGLSRDVADELSLASPFDYAHQALLYVPRDLPDPSGSDFSPAASTRMIELIEFNPGGTFCLFTSWRSLRQTAAQLAPPLKRLKRTLLCQGDAPKAALLEMFRAAGDAVLLATSSFWQGVDVVGPALSLVVIHKLPFAVPTDPLHQARMRQIERAGGDPFHDYQLPQAALQLKQGFGRLIRSRRDRGVVAILDRRIVVKQYGRGFLASLPGKLPRTSALESVRRFWQVPSPQSVEKVPSAKDKKVPSPQSVETPT